MLQRTVATKKKNVAWKRVRGKREALRGGREKDERRKLCQRQESREEGSSSSATLTVKKRIFIALAAISGEGRMVTALRDDTIFLVF